MACFDENRLIEIARGQLGAAALAEAERHLAGCDDCARALTAIVPEVTLAGVGRGAGPLSTIPRARADGLAHLLPVGTVLCGRYRIVRFIGRGGMGEVYEAAHTRLAGRFAVKVLGPQVAVAPSVLSRFKREADITATLRHPNIVQVFDFDDTPDGRPFLAMEYLEGRHLGELIFAEGPLPFSRVVEIVAPVVSALAFIHKQQIVHRDLKPQNIMLVTTGEGDAAGEVVKLLDFGLSKRWGSPSDSLLLSGERVLLGTPMYMAPEQARGETDTADAATDQFALAAIVYEMLTRRAPFVSKSIPDLLHQIGCKDPAPIRGLAPELPASAEEALTRALSKTPAQRFASVRDFLDAFRGERSTPTPTPTPMPMPVVAPVAVVRAPPPRRRAPVAMGAAAFVLLGGALAVWRGRPIDRAEPPATHPIPVPPPAASRPPPTEERARDVELIPVRLEDPPADPPLPVPRAKRTRRAPRAPEKAPDAPASGVPDLFPTL